MKENTDNQTPDWDKYRCEWQDYELFKPILGFFDDADDDDIDDDDDFDTEGEYPTFFKFFDKHQGTKRLFAMHDMRIGKETYYMDEARRLYHQKREADAKANGTWREPPDSALRQEWRDHSKNPHLFECRAIRRGG